jgi:hypothetical protein
MTAEWDCEGCGLHSVAVDGLQPPAHRLCSCCAWVSVHIPPQEIADVMRRIGLWPIDWLVAGPVEQNQ